MSRLRRLSGDDIRWFLVSLALAMGVLTIAGIYLTTRAVFRPPRSSQT
jgi:hypothetical protein